MCEHISFTTWKHTSPANSTSTLMVSHDIDGTTGIDTMLIFSKSEKSMDIIATYNITVRYFSDAINADFYNDSKDKISEIIQNGHVIASHFVGHFPDFGDTIAFPMGSADNHIVDYLPYNDGIKT